MNRSSLRLMIGGFLALAAGAALACPFCAGPQLTMAEQVQQADAVALVRWASGTPAKDQDPGSTDYEILEILRQPETSDFERGQELTLVRYRAAKPGDLFLLLGTKSGAILDWG